MAEAVGLTPINRQLNWMGEDKGSYVMLTKQFYFDCLFKPVRFKAFKNLKYKITNIG